jgi:deazaflavin-dependent oxidoreductase (nitroreductase family)
VIDDFRANQGRVGGAFEGTPLLLLHHVGARSGKDRVNPVGYLEKDGRYVVIASNGGAANTPHWYYNLKARPKVTIELGTKVVPVMAREAIGEERERLFGALVDRFPHLTEYAENADRVIPVIVLTPA